MLVYNIHNIICALRMLHVLIEQDRTATSNREQKATTRISAPRQSSDSESIGWYKTFARCQLYVIRTARSEKSDMYSTLSW